MEASQGPRLATQKPSPPRRALWAMIVPCGLDLLGHLFPNVGPSDGMGYEAILISSPFALSSHLWCARASVLVMDESGCNGHHLMHVSHLISCFLVPCIRCEETKSCCQSPFLEVSMPASPICRL